MPLQHAPLADGAAAGPDTRCGAWTPAWTGNSFVAGKRGGLAGTVVCTLARIGWQVVTASRLLDADGAVVDLYVVSPKCLRGCLLDAS